MNGAWQEGLSYIFSSEKSRRTVAAQSRWLGKEAFSVSLGLMYDPERRLIWAMNGFSRAHVLRLDRKTADVEPLEAALGTR